MRAFIAAHEQLPDADSPTRDAHLRARAAVLAIVESLRDAHRGYDDAPVTLADLLTTIRRWIEGQTFSPRTGDAGILLLDAASAGYADIDDLRLVGLVDADWPEKGRRNIFYPAPLLGQLGWSAEGERVAAARARFHDLMRLPRHRTAISTFTLEDDAIVPGSVFVEEIDRAGLPVEHLPRAGRRSSAASRGDIAGANRGHWGSDPRTSMVVSPDVTDARSRRFLSRRRRCA